LSLGMRVEAEAAYRRVTKLVEERLELVPEDSRACVLGASAFASLEQPDRAIALIERALAIDPEDPMLLYNIACGYANLGRLDEALDSLESAVDKGYGHKEWIEHDSDFAPIRENPRFKAILETMS
jgi:adenylate cyclase